MDLPFAVASECEASGLKMGMGGKYKVMFLSLTRSVDRRYLVIYAEQLVEMGLR